MNARETLESYGELVHKLDSFQHELALCLCHAAKEPQALERWQRRMKALKADIRKHRRLCQRRSVEIEQLLMKMPDETMRKVLALRYLSLLSHAEISEVLHFSLRHVYRIHRQAAERLQAIMTPPG